MCLGVPGKITEIKEGFPKMGKVSFGGIIKDVCLDCVPEAKIDDYVVVHVGFAISILNEQEAQETLNYLKEIEVIE